MIVRNKNRRRMLWIVALGLVLGMLAVYGRTGGLSASTLIGAQPTAEGAPPFAFTTFDGKRIALGDLAGKPVVLNFWASWCTPCRAEMPYFETTYQSYRERDVVFLGLAVQDNVADSQAFLREVGVTYPTGPDDGNAITLRYQVTGMPTTFFITPDGRVVRRWIGAISEEQLVTMVEEIVP